MSFMDELNQTNFNEQHRMKDKGPAYSFLQWHSGNAQGAAGSFDAAGGFFLAEKQFPTSFRAGRPLDRMVHQNGNETFGLGFKGLHLAPLAFRLDWYVQHNDGSKTFFGSYDQAARGIGPGEKVAGRTRYVCLVKELDPDTYGPFMVTVNRTAGQHLQKTVGLFYSSVRAPIERIFGKSLPDYALWIPIKAGAPVQASPKYPTKVVPPVLAIGEDLSEPKLRELAERLFIGKAMLEVAERHWDAAQEWAEAAAQGQFGEPDMEARNGNGNGREEEAERPFRGGGSQPNTDNPPWY